MIRFTPFVFFVMDDEVNSETGFPPMDLMFGSEDGPYLRLPDTALSSEISEVFVKNLDANLKDVRSKSRIASGGQGDFPSRNNPSAGSLI